MKAFVLALSLLYGPYQADLVRVIDGDTIEVDLHVYPGEVVRVSVRENGINTPEKRPKRPKGMPDTDWLPLKSCEKELGLNATAFAGRFLQGKRITVENVKRGKYAGRVLGNIYANDVPLAAVMLANGYARAYSGGKRGPWCTQLDDG